MSLGKRKFFPGKTVDAMIYKPGDLPECCTETIVSDHEYLVVRFEFTESTMDCCLHRCIHQIYFVYESFTVGMLW